MSLPRTDSFAAAAGPLDATWTQQSGSVSLRYDGSGNATAGADLGAWLFVFDNQNTYSNDQSSKIILAGACASGFDYEAVTTRASGTGTNSLYALITDLTSGPGHTFLRKWVGGSPTDIGSFAVTFVAGDELELRSIGTNHEAFKNGVSIGSFTDADIATGSAGCGLYDETVGLTPLIASWTGDNAAAPPATVLSDIPHSRQWISVIAQ